MTYISRRTRIVVPRWLDGCDDEHRYRVSRKRSDGKLKRYGSCDDLRAWVNNNCIRHDYLVELMSNGESEGISPVHVYGRFIPVPVLVELMQGIQNPETDVHEGREEQGEWNENQECADRNNSNKKSGSDDSSLESHADFIKFQCENYLLEKRLFECTNLLCRAVGKLEKIDNIICVASDEFENNKNEDIEEGLKKKKAICSCSAQGLSSKLSLRRDRDSMKSADLLRKISGLREKLKKIGECSNDIKRQIKSSQQKLEKGSSNLQVTELYNRHEHENIDKLEKKLEKLIGKRGKLLSEMCRALCCRNHLRKTSKSSMSFRGGKASRSNVPEKREEVNEWQSCGCNCADPSDSDKMECSQSNSSERCFKMEESDNARQTENNCQQQSEKSSTGRCPEMYKNLDPERLSSLGSYVNNADETKKSNKSPSGKKSIFGRVFSSKSGDSINSNNQMKECDKKKEGKMDGEKGKEKVKFVCPQKNCQEQSYLDNLAYYQNIENRKKAGFVNNSVVDVRNVSAEYLSARETDEDRNCAQNFPPESQRSRKIKSETTMKEIEKTLRNYEKRLKSFDSLEYKVENLKQKLSEAVELKRKLLKRKEEGKKLQVAEKEKSNKEITKLCWENWELKRQVEHLTAKFDMQSKKVEALKCHKNKLRELEGETEELKKELTEYQENFEDQRKCITKLENVVVAQKTEMEKLMDHIRQLTTMRESVSSVSYQEKKNPQRSRSYSPEAGKIRRTNNRPRAQAGTHKMSSEEEDSYAAAASLLCCHCEDLSRDTQKRNPMNDERSCCYQPPRRTSGRCMS